jgi:hypothetical protein
MKAAATIKLEQVATMLRICGGEIGIAMNINGGRQPVLNGWRHSCYRLAEKLESLVHEARKEG